MNRRLPNRSWLVRSGILPWYAGGAVTPPADLIDLYLFREDTGTTVANEGTGGALTLVNTPSWVAGKGVTFVPASSHYATGINAFPTAPPFTAFWVGKRNPSTSLKQRIVAQGLGSANRAFIFGLDPSVATDTDAPTSWNTAFWANDKFLGATWPDQEYFSAAFTIDADRKATLYINGYVAWETTYASGINIAPNNPTLGAAFGRTTEFFDGVMSAYAKANRALSLAEIQQLHSFVRQEKPSLGLRRVAGSVPWYFSQHRWASLDATTEPYLFPEGATYAWEDNDPFGDFYWLEDDGTWYGYYFGVAANGIGRTGVVTAATRGGTPTKYVSNPILDAGPATYDQRIAIKAAPVKIGDTFWLFYTGASSADNATKRICAASASDPLGPWTKSASNPIASLAPTGVDGDWNRDFLDAATVALVDGVLHMWVAGGNVEAGGTWQVGHFTADPADPLTWTPDAANPVIEAHENGWAKWMAPGRVDWDSDANLWVMSVNGGSTRGTAEAGYRQAGFWYSASLNGKWTESPVNPILSPAVQARLWDGRSTGQWDAQRIWRTGVYLDGASPELWYNAKNVGAEGVGNGTADPAGQGY